MEKLEQLQQWIDESKYIVFFGGAGVSTESGVPDFRSVDGLYNQKYSEPPETILSHTYFMRRPEGFFRFYRDKMLPLQARPNDAHKKLAELEQAGKLKAVVTQNIDGLHQKAGSKEVLELHGSVLRNYCESCGKFYGVEAVAESDGVPRCACGGYRAVEHIRKADLLIIGGTSLVVYPAAGLVNYYKGNKLVLINLQPTPYDRYADLTINEKIGQVFREIRV